MLIIEKPMVEAKKTKVWPHAFALKELVDGSFTIFFQRGFKFCALAIIAFILAIPLIYTTFTSFKSVLVDEFEIMMLMFNLFLSCVRLFFLKILFNYVRDGYREMEFNSYDKMISIQNRGILLYKRKTDIFHLSDIDGLVIEALKEVDLAPTSSSQTFNTVNLMSQEVTDQNFGFEVSLKLKCNRDIILFPYLNTVQEARTIALQISNKTSLPILTNLTTFITHYS